jgi:restriction system protein
MIGIAREAARAETRRAKEAQQQQRRQAKLAREAEKLEKKAYLESRMQEAQEEAKAVQETVHQLSNLLVSCLRRDSRPDFSGMLKKKVYDNDLNAWPELTQPPAPQLTTPAAPGFFARLLPGSTSRHELLVKKAEQQYFVELEHLRKITALRQQKLAALREEAENHNAELEDFIERYKGHESQAIIEYCEMVLLGSEFPDGFPQNPKVAFVTESKQLVVEQELPTVEIIPAAEKFRYVRASDEIVQTSRTNKTINQLYASIVSQSVLRCLRDLFWADTASALESIVLNGVVSTIDPATGKRVRPCIVSVRTTRDQFLSLDLAHVDPVLCLRELKATVSRQPGELVAVKPIVEFNMVDPRFVEKTDVLSSLDQRPNLMELSPGEFESLITNLFEKMGLETRLTQASRDGGVDCVAFDSRPILGGKVVIQAKRYKNTVGVSAVRDLFGTMHNEGASKGILVTTSGYGKAAYEFANGKPLELIAGSNLIFLLREHTGCDAKIEMPPDWSDADHP